MIWTGWLTNKSAWPNLRFISAPSCPRGRREAKHYSHSIKQVVHWHFTTGRRLHGFKPRFSCPLLTLLLRDQRSPLLDLPCQMLARRKLMTPSNGTLGYFLSPFPVSPFCSGPRVIRNVSLAKEQRCRWCQTLNSRAEAVVAANNGGVVWRHYSTIASERWSDAWTAM